MCNHDFITSFADVCSEIGMNGHESDVQDAACSEGVCYLFTYNVPLKSFCISSLSSGYVDIYHMARKFNGSKIYDLSILFRQEKLTDFNPVTPLIVLAFCRHQYTDFKFTVLQLTINH